MFLFCSRWSTSMLLCASCVRLVSVLPNRRSWSLSWWSLKALNSIWRSLTLWRMWKYFWRCSVRGFVAHTQKKGTFSKRLYVIFKNVYQRFWLWICWSVGHNEPTIPIEHLYQLCRHVLQFITLQRTAIYDSLLRTTTQCVNPSREQRYYSWFL